MGEPRLSIVIPIFNEEGILHSAVVDLVSRLSELRWSYEILLSENGSTDRTVAIAEELAQKFPEDGLSVQAIVQWRSHPGNRGGSQ